jgi:mono/diheme cytochrome c family protein
MKETLLLVTLTLVLTACGSQGNETSTRMSNEGMMTRHHAEIPAKYAGLTNPIPADAASLERGAALYATNCASCHGDGGMGDGPAGTALDPAPAPVAHTSQMMADDYLFWRVSEGGTPFATSMPGWKVLDEQSRWDMVNYMRALGSGTVNPAVAMGGEAYDPEVQAARQAEMLAQAVEQGVVAQEEADIFKLVHDAVEQYRTEHPEILDDGSNATKREAAILAALVKENIITQAQADAFTGIHDRLGSSGLMP